MLARVALALALLASPTLAGPADDLGAAVSKATGLPLRSAQEIGTGLVFLELGRPGMVTDMNGSPAPRVQPDPKRQYQGLQVELGSGKPPVLVEHLTFADASVALEYADMLINPEGEFSGRDTVVDVRGTSVVTVRGAPRAVAEKAIKAAWATPAAAQGAKAPRTYFAFRDQEGMGILGAPRGALQEEVQKSIDAGRKNFPSSGAKGDLSLTWGNAERTKFAFKGSPPTSTRIDVDASGKDLRVVQGNEQTIAGMNAELDRLAAATAGGGSPDQPAARPAALGFGRALGAAMAALEPSTAKGDGGVPLFTRKGQQGFFTADGKPYAGTNITQPIR